VWRRAWAGVRTGWGRVQTVGTLAVVVVPLALVLRWGLVERSSGPSFSPRPDSLEYAAAAHSLAAEGRYVLHVGPYEAPPRPPPGWPLLLSLLVRAGVVSESLWRITAVFGAAHALLLAIITARAVQLLLAWRGWLANDPRTRRRMLLAGLIAGGGWAIAPLSVDWDRTLMNDQATAFLAHAALFLAAIGLLGESRSRGRTVGLLLAGLAAGWALAMRPMTGYLLLGPVVALAIGGARLHGVRRTAGRLAWPVSAVLLVVGVVGQTMRASGRPFGEWSGYSYWLPELYGHLDRVFNIRHATQGHASFALRHRRTHEPMGNLEVAVRTLLGLPGLPKVGNAHLGQWWPMTAWLCAAALAAAVVWRQQGSRRVTAVTLIVMMLVWFAGHLAVYTLYFFPQTRFYLPVMVWCWVAVGVAAAVWWDGSWRRRAVLGYVVGSSFVLTAVSLRPMLVWTTLGPDRDNQAVRAAFADWRTWSDERRAGTMVPFDPVHAQALGLLAPEVLAVTRVWGPLPAVEHVWRLKNQGKIPN